MLYVYLDQLHWISLAKADHRRGGNAYLDSLALVDAGARSGYASFPLSSAHYLETANIADDARRARLAQTMGRLSRFHAIAPQAVIQSVEIDHALNKMFGRPIRPRQV